MKLKLIFAVIFLQVILIGNAQENYEPHVCHPPTIERIDKEQLANKTVDSPNVMPAGIVAYTQSIHNVIVKWETGSFGAFRIGTAPGLQDIRWGQGLNGQARHTGGHSYEDLRLSAQGLGNTFNIGDTFYITMDPGLASEWVSPPLVFQWENLGDPTNSLTINIETNYGAGGYGPYNATQAAKMMDFYNLVNPIIEDIYGPPSRNHSVNVVNDAYAQGVNIYYNGPNQISSTFVLNGDGDLDQPRLMIHELIHAYRDNVGLSSNEKWHYEPELSGFEEGMAEAMAIIVMDRFIGLYPNFFAGDEFKIHWNHSRGMPFSWDYDFQNHEQIRNKDYFSSDIATGGHWIRYGMGATAFRKMYIEDNDIFKKFNAEYYSRLNADHNLLPSRALFVDIFETVSTEVERTPVKEWINEQKILDCDVELEKKVFMLTFTNISWAAFTQDNRIFFLETHENNKEWAWDSSDAAGANEIDGGANTPETWGWTHQLNNVPGQFTAIQDWDNTAYAGSNKNIVNDYHGLFDGQFLLGPYQGANPYRSFDGIAYDDSGQFTRDYLQNQNYPVGAEMGKRALAIGSQQLYTSTADDANFWPPGIIADRKITDMDQSGLYRWEIAFNDPQGPTVEGSYFRMLGDDFVDVKGVFGGIYSETNDSVDGKLIIEHEDFGEEPEITISNNAFKSSRPWASILEADVNRQGGRNDRRYSEPGKIHNIFISSDCTQRKIDFRTIGYGDGLDGIQMMLFKVEEMEDIIFTESADLDVCLNDSASFTVTNNFPDILDGDSRITYRWLNPTGTEVSTTLDYDIASVTAADQGTYTLEIDFFGCVISKTVDLNLGCASNIDFDGTDDYANRSSLIGGLSASTMMGWIKVDEVRGADIMGQDSFRIFTDNSGQLQAEVKTGTTTTTVAGGTTAITPNIWSHVAATYDGVSDALTLYINGEQVAQVATTGNALSVDANDFEIGRRSNGDDRYFKGDMQELRVYDAALSSTQLQEQIYQQVEDNGGKVRGISIPKDIDGGSLNWNNLMMYLKLDPAAVVAGMTVDDSAGANDLSINNMTTNQVLGAPVPYQASTSGSWTTPATWTNGTEWDITSLPNKDWAIVQVTNNAKVTTTASHTHLGLLLDAGSELEIQDDQLLANTSYVKLDGEIDLEGESQFIQTIDSDLDVASSGTLERDQQGSQDLYTYNYWASPVGATNNVANNNSYTVPEIFNDGTDSSAPININFLTTGYDGANGSPISIADFWIWKYGNLAPDYYNWEHVRSTGSLMAGEGFSMKGVNDTNGNVTLEQNYVLKGKPNNAEILLTIDNGNNYLVGNPYASALDANQFIADNTTTTGTLLYWEHWGGGTHNTTGYKGGYAMYNLSGAVPAMQYDFETGGTLPGGTPNKLPGRYVPVAQGFFVVGTSSGNITFNNGQRIFVKEGADSVFIRNGDGSTVTNTSNTTDDRLKIRLGYKSVNEEYSRQILVTVDDQATPEVDFGYDGENIDTQIHDMHWVIDNRNFAIQGIDAIDESTILPLGLKTELDGVNTIKIDALENVPSDLEIYVYDLEEDAYHDLRNSNFTIDLPMGEYVDRFELRFSSVLGTDEFEDESGIQFYFANDNESIVVENPKSKNVESVELFNILGQTIVRYDGMGTQEYSEFKTSNISTGSYVLEIVTEGGKISKKVLIE